MTSDFSVTFKLLDKLQLLLYCIMLAWLSCRILNASLHSKCSVLLASYPVNGVFYLRQLICLSLKLDIPQWIFNFLCIVVLSCSPISKVVNNNIPEINLCLVPQWPAESLNQLKFLFSYFNSFLFVLLRSNKNFF